jgi:hypothetical protein
VAKFFGYIIRLMGASEKPFSAEDISLLDLIFKDTY